MLLTYEKIEEEWFCFFQEANFHIIDKQLLISLTKSHVVSRIMLPPLVLTINQFKIHTDID